MKSLSRFRIKFESSISTSKFNEKNLYLRFDIESSDKSSYKKAELSKESSSKVSKNYFQVIFLSNLTLESLFF